MKPRGVRVRVTRNFVAPLCCDVYYLNARHCFWATHKALRALGLPPLKPGESVVGTFRFRKGETWKSSS